MRQRQPPWEYGKSRSSVSSKCYIFAVLPHNLLHAQPGSCLWVRRTFYTENKMNTSWLAYSHLSYHPLTVPQQSWMRWGTHIFLHSFFLSAGPLNVRVRFWYLVHSWNSVTLHPWEACSSHMKRTPSAERVTKTTPGSAGIQAFYCRQEVESKRWQAGRPSDW